MVKRKELLRDKCRVPIKVQASDSYRPMPNWFVSNAENIGAHLVVHQPSPINSLQSYRPDKPKEEPALKLHWYSSLQSDTVVVVLKHPSNFVLCGHVCVNPLLGAVHIFGARITKPTVLYGSKDFNAFTADTLLEGRCSLAVLNERLHSESVMTSEDIDDLNQRLDISSDIVLLLSAVWIQPLFHANHYLKIPLMPVKSNTYSLVPDFKKIARCAIDVSGSKHYPTYRVPTSWLQLKFSSRTVVVGGASSGKSTLCKYIVNRLLNKHDTVLYMECDLGQGEFSPPGCVAVYLLNEPALGPNFTHQRSPIKMIFLGEVDVVKCSSNYSSAIEYLVHKVALHQNAQIPWVVNTMGFCQGLGVQLTYHIIRHVQPSTVIQLNSDQAKLNFKQLLTAKRVRDNVPLSYNHVLLDSACNHAKSILTKRDLRELKILSHLSTVLTAPGFSLNEVQPYIISFSELYIGINANIAANDVLRVLNGALVAICKVPTLGANLLETAHDAGEWFKIVLKPAVQPCLELGLVRGIDLEKREVHLVTPLPLTMLLDVRMLVVGNLQVPQSIMTAQPTMNGPLLYTARSSDSLPFTTVRRIHRQSPSQSVGNDSLPSK